MTLVALYLEGAPISSLDKGRSTDIFAGIDLGAPFGSVLAARSWQELCHA